jgi:hypothetical protein
MLTPNNTKIVMRSGSSFARGTTIDLYLEPAEITALYEKWKSEWGEVLELPGSEKAITCEMVKAVSLYDLTKTYGKPLGKKLNAEAQSHSIID